MGRYAILLAWIECFVQSDHKTLKGLTTMFEKKRGPKSKKTSEQIRDEALAIVAKAESEIAQQKFSQVPAMAGLINSAIALREQSLEAKLALESSNHALNINSILEGIELRKIQAIAKREFFNQVLAYRKAKDIFLSNTLKAATEKLEKGEAIDKVSAWIGKVEKEFTASNPIQVDYLKSMESYNLATKNLQAFRSTHSNNAQGKRNAKQYSIA
jgi:hypothetical protein